MLSLRMASASETEIILDLVRTYYTEEGYPYHEVELRRAIRQLLDNQALGRVWLAKEGETGIAYCVLTWGVSLEHRGRDAFIDELYVLPGHRGRGIGQAALRLAEEACREEGVRALHLEVERVNLRAQSLYRRLGFVDHDRYLMTKSVKSCPDQ